MTDLLVFDNRETDEQLFVGGMSVSTMLKKHKNILDIEGSLFTRFSNLVVPVGLQIQTNVVDENNTNDEEGSFIDSKKFDTLFYSVGKDLGISKSRTYKNRTMKNPTK
jgi:hypothetical protein